MRDRYTNTERDAAAFERAHHGGAGDDRPSPSDVCNHEPDERPCRYCGEPEASSEHAPGDGHGYEPITLESDPFEFAAWLTSNGRCAVCNGRGYTRPFIGTGNPQQRLCDACGGR